MDDFPIDLAEYMGSFQTMYQFKRTPYIVVSGGKYIAPFNNYAYAVKLSR